MNIKRSFFAKNLLCKTLLLFILLNKILEKIKLKPIYLTDSTMEVDNHEDLAKARDLFQKK